MISNVLAQNTRSSEFRSLPVFDDFDQRSTLQQLPLAQPVLIALRVDMHMGISLMALIIKHNLIPLSKSLNSYFRLSVDGSGYGLLVTYYTAPVIVKFVI